jgi:hypothetical protein
MAFIYFYNKNNNVNEGIFVSFFFSWKKGNTGFEDRWAELKTYPERMSEKRLQMAQSLSRRTEVKETRLTINPPL